jgi:hypothetical protein
MKGLKLSNKQVEVLAEEIYKELEVEANKYKESEEYKNFEDSLKNTEEAKLYRKATKVFDEIKEKGFKCSSWEYHCNYITEFYSGFVKREKSKKYPSKSIPSESSIRNKIILNTIDVDNLEDLINKVKDSLKTV